MPQNVIPFADYRPIAWAENRDDDTNPTCVVLHLTASEATSQYSYFSNPANNACSNAHVARGGYIEQYIRGDRLSAADAYGSHRSFSVETQGADAGGRWTAEQCESIARILAWAHQTYGIPLRLMTSSAASERGVGWHRLGIDGNFPSMPNILAGRMQRGGGEKWSSAFGKVCPGDNRIKQIPDIIDRALAIVAGATNQEDDMTPDESNRLKAVESAVDRIEKLLTDPLEDGDMMAPPRTMWRRAVAVPRRIDGRLVAREAVPVEVDVDATAVAEELLARLPKATAEAVVDTMNARLAQ